MATKHLSSPFPGSKFSFQIGHSCTLPKEHCSTIIPLGSALRAHGGNCDDIPCTIFVRLLHETDDEALLLKIHKVVFVFPDHRKVTKNMVPFSHHFTAKENIDIQVFILLEDGSSHQFTYRIILTNVSILTCRSLYSSNLGYPQYACDLHNESNERKEIRSVSSPFSNPTSSYFLVQPLELSDKVYSVEIVIVSSP
jgi:hypothetical protein